MNTREKILAITVGALALLFAGVFAVRAVFLEPVRDMDAQIAQLRGRLEKSREDRRAFFANEDFLKRIGRTALAATANRAASRSGEMLAEAIQRAGLVQTDFSLIPSGTRMVRGANEVGWTVQGEGALRQIVDLMCLLDDSLPLHRLENLSLVPAERGNRVRARFRYLTLVLSPAPDVPFLGDTNLLAFSASDRSRFQIIQQRNFLWPLVKQVLSPSAPVQEDRSAPASGAENFRIVSLSEWSGIPEVHVLDIAKQTTQRFKAGDAIAGGAIVRVDYRPMPIPGKGGLVSFGRVILQIDSEYWAVEQGQTLSDAYRLQPEQLPEDLKKTEPAEPSPAGVSEP